MEWTKEAPTTPGFYFFKGDLCEYVECMQLIECDDPHDEKHLHQIQFDEVTTDSRPEDFVGWWYGPIEVPKITFNC